MLKVDLTITISVILAACAIISPILTTLINNHHLRKMRKLEIKEAKAKEQSFYKRKIYEDFIKASYKCIACADKNSLHEFGESFALVRLYMPSEYSQELDSLNYNIRNCNWNKVQPALDKLINDIHNLIQQS